MRLIPIKTPLIKPGQNLFDLFLNVFKKTPPKNKDIIVISSKIISYAQNRVFSLKKIKISKKARQMGRKFNLLPSFCQYVINEADEIYNGVSKAILTRKNNILIANAGIDKSNTKPGYVALWPINLESYLDKLKSALTSHYQAEIGLIAADSHCHPERLGTSGFALAISGFEGIIDDRGKKDLFNQKMTISRQNIADNLASAASALMGERRQKMPLVIIQNAPVRFSHKTSYKLTKELLISSQACLFRNYNLKYN